MPRPRPLSLRTFVYRTLTLRLAFMVVVISLLSTVAVYLSERQNLQSQVVEEARNEIRLLTAQTLRLVQEKGLTPRAAFHQTLKDRLTITVQHPNGQFVYVDFFQPGTTDNEEHLATDYPLIDPVVRFAHARLPTAPVQGEQAETLFIGDKLHIWVLMPLLETSATNPPSAQAIFVPSDKTLKAIQRKLHRSVFLALLIVGATSLILYPVILQLVNKLTQFSHNLLEANLDTLTLLASAIAKRDSDTDIHNFRVTLYAVRLAEALHLENKAIQTIIKGAFLHDVGKIGVRDDILLKPGKLNQLEFNEMQAHVRYGLDIISSSSWLADAALVVGGHHEQYDGSGYPEGVAGEAIPLSARIFAVADVFDALSSKRPYKEPLSFEATMDLIQQGRGSHFDPAIVDTFATIAPKLYHDFAGREDQGLRDAIQSLIACYFSQGEIVLD
ncbi:MAG: HD domain-containing protein [Desulfobulbus sp.]|nr:HD domain-containing protein [Desulfobulbus sp.]